MRTVTVNHRDFRGRTDYWIYETKEKLLHDIPEANISENLADAKEGDYVQSCNGWLVPLLQITHLDNSYYVRDTKRWKRKKTYTHRVYHFPKQKLCISENKIGQKTFNYVPASSKNISSDEKRNRMYELSKRKIQWAQFVINGISPEDATTIVYPNVFNRNALTKSLLLNEKLMNYIIDRTKKVHRHEMDNAGLTGEFILKVIKSTIEDPNENPQLRIMAMTIANDLIMKYT